MGVQHTALFACNVKFSTSLIRMAKPVLALISICLNILT